ncbi:MAG: hypothetical protein LBU82_01455, partial [Treponema sp.]|nr:hypothetical protein [Treponema sp.]
SGWSYNSQEQTLMVKMKHRSPVETIRIIYREASRPAIVVPPQPVVEPGPVIDNTPAPVPDVPVYQPPVYQAPVYQPPVYQAPDVPAFPIPTGETNGYY